MRSILLFISFLAIYSQAQDSDSLTLLNGKYVIGNNASEKDGYLYIDVKDKNGTIVNEEYELERVFSVSTAGEEKVYYQMDELQGNYLTVEEARFTTWGSRDARVTSNPIGVFVSSIAIGYAASLYDTYFSQKDYDLLATGYTTPPDLNVGFFGSSPSVFQLMIPTTLTLVWTIPSFKVKKKKVLYLPGYGNDFYYRGYNRIAKQKRMFAALGGSLIGTGLGLISYGIFKIN